MVIKSAQFHPNPADKEEYLKSEPGINHGSTGQITASDQA